MVSKIGIALLMITLITGQVWGVQSVAQPADALDYCKVAPDLSSCRGYLEGPAPKPSTLCCYRLTLAIRASDPRCLCRALRGGASIAVNKDQGLSLAHACKLQPYALGPCYDGSGITESPTESPKEMSSSSTYSTDSVCPGCETGNIDDPGTLVPIPP